MGARLVIERNHCHDKIGLFALDVSVAGVEGAVLVSWTPANNSLNSFAASKASVWIDRF